MALDAVRAELTDVAELLEAYQRANIQPGSAEWLTMEALRRREVSLHHELSILDGSAEIEVRLQGGDRTPPRSPEMLEAYAGLADAERALGEAHKYGYETGDWGPHREAVAIVVEWHAEIGRIAVG